MKRLITLLALIYFCGNVKSQCTYTVIASYTPATCSTCCDGIIKGSVSGTGCNPITLTLQPLGITNPTSTYTNLCPGSYTIASLDACFCLGICGVNLPFNSTGLNEMTYLSSEMIIYPNPVSSTLFISTNQKEFENYEIEIINYLGQTVLKTKFKSELDVSEFSNGVYFLQLKNSQNQMAVKRFVIAR